MEKRKINPLIFGIIPSIIFGFSFMFTKIGLLSFDSVFHLIGIRFLFAAVALYLLKLVGLIKIDFRGRNIWPILVLSLFQPFGYFTFETIGIKLTSSSQAGIMIAFIPVVVTILAAVFLKEKTSMKQWAFILLSIGGILLVNINNLSIEGNILGMGVLFLTVFVAGVYQILARRNSNLFNPVEITYIMMWFGAIVFNAIACVEMMIKGDVTAYFEPLKNFQTLMAVSYLGILSSVVAFLVLNYILSKVEASRASVLANLTTIVSIVAGVVILGESFETIQYVGGALILIGVWGASRK